MPQGMEEKYQTTNQARVPTTSQLSRPSFNYKDVLGGVRPLPHKGLVSSVPTNTPPTNVQILPEKGMVGANLSPPPNTVSILPARAGVTSPNRQAVNYAAEQSNGLGASVLGNALDQLQSEEFRSNYNPFLTTPQANQTGEPREPNRPNPAMITPDDIMNTIQPTGQPQPQIPSDIAQVMQGIEGYFSQNPDAANSIFGQGGLASFQQRINSLFAPPQIVRSPNYANSLAGQVAGRGGSVLQGLKNLFANRQA